MERSGTVFHYGELARAKNYLDWIIPALYRHRDFRPVLEWLEMEGETAGPLYQDESSFDVQIFSGEQLLEAEREFQNSRAEKFAAEKGPAGQKEAEETMRLEKEAEAAFAKRYRWEASLGLPATMSVSELKRASMEPEEGMAALYDGRGENSRTAKEAAARGTAWHHVLELLPLGRMPENHKKEWLLEILKELEEAGKLRRDEREMVETEALAGFLESPLCGRMAAADRRGSLKREEQFVIGVPAGQVKPLSEPEERLVMVQGVIDAWFEEDGELILVDYKTDRLPEKGGEEILVRRYKTQLNYYEQALTMAAGRPVRERYLYSFSLGRAVKG